MSKSLTTREQEIEAATQRLDTLALEAAQIGCVPDIQKQFTGALKMARVVKELQECVRVVIPELKHLIGNPLGFLTDKTYTDDELVAPITEALVRGIRVTGNQFNIISKRCYITKDGIKQMLSDLPGLSDYRENFIFEKTEEFNGKNIVHVTCYAKWKWHGEEHEMKEIIPVRLNSGMGPDAAVGKASRKIRARVYERLTNASIPDGDASEGPIIEQAPRPRFSPPPPRQTEPADVEQLDDEVSQLLAKIMDSGIEPKWFQVGFENQKVIAKGQPIKDMTPEAARGVLAKWASVEKYVRALEGGAK